MMQKNKRFCGPIMLTFSLKYFLFALALFFVELLIALYVHDSFIRPYVGDYLVVMLMYCAVRAFIKITPVKLAIGVLLFSYVIEVLQFFTIVDKLGLSNNKLAKTVIGFGFEWYDLLAYTLGVATILVLETVNRLKTNVFSKKSGHTIYAVFLLLGCGFTRTCIGQDSFKIYKQDVLNFWEAYDTLLPGSDTAAIFQNLVINRASKPFKQFIINSNITSKNYAEQIRRFPKFYRSLRATSLKLIDTEKEIRLLVSKLRNLYPEIVPADICIGIGNFKTGGTIHVDKKNRLVYIGLEYHAVDSNTIVSEFNSSMREYFSRSNFFRTVIHELVHVQQETHGRAVRKSYHGDKLIHSVLKEGIPDFVASLIYPEGNNGIYTEYGVQYETELKEKLKTELWQSGTKYWLYNSKTVVGQPIDLGYFMGARIANAYYERNRSNTDVIKQIIELRQIETFVDKSGYFIK